LDNIPLPLLVTALVACILISGFFSGSETSLMSINRYRLKTRAQKGERGARMAQALLERPDRLIGLILLLNNVAQALIPMLLLVIGQRVTGNPETAVLVATIGTALLIFIFSESMPKTLGAINPERLGLPAAYVYWPIIKLFGWAIDIVNFVGNRMIRLLGVSSEEAAQHSLSTEELRTVVAEAGAMIPQRHQKMLLSILDLEKGTVEDIMVPRNEIMGVDVSLEWDQIREQIMSTQHTRLPIYSGSIDELVGVVHVRRLMPLLADGKLDTKSLVQLAKDPYFIPEGTPLNQQLLNFQNQKRRIGFVVDEYGDIQGLVTLEDILEEVVGEFTSDPATRIKNVYADPDGSYRMSGSVTLRSLNRSLGWKLPTDGPKTVNGLLLEKLENIPQAGRQVEIGGYLFEITETRSNAVRATRVRPPVKPLPDKKKKAA
jgi:Mg2+/Co2+ transporter CorB